MIKNILRNLQEIDSLMENLKNVDFSLHFRHEAIFLFAGIISFTFK